MVLAGKEKSEFMEDEKTKRPLECHSVLLSWASLKETEYEEAGYTRGNFIVPRQPLACALALRHRSNNAKSQLWEF